jgi:hypothetical protein
MYFYSDTAACQGSITSAWAARPNWREHQAQGAGG